MPSFWSVPPLWQGETAFVVAGGPSATTQGLDRLRDRKTIAINSAIENVPWAQFLIFGDNRWWNEYGRVIGDHIAISVGVSPWLNNRCLNATVDRRKKIMRAPHSVVCCTKQLDGPFRRLRWIDKPGLAADRSEAFMRRTTLTAALTLASHLGANRIVMLGADGKPAADGRTHHHAPHPWQQRPNCWDEQRADLAAMVKPLKEHGIEVINASPGSDWGLWQVVSLDDALTREKKAGPRE